METALKEPTESVHEAMQMAKDAGLKYVNDSRPGFTRERKNDKYQYFRQDGTLIEDEKIITRINKLIIPHVWTKVWICPQQNGHMQATGLDSKNRKQYRYHKEWDKIRNENKFDKMMAFGTLLPDIRKKIEAHLSKKELSREKVLSTIVAILDENLIRIGNREYAKTNKTYGLTTLRNKHVKNLGNKVQLEFIGKKSIEKKVIISDKRLSSIIKKCKEIPGHDLFQYYDADNKVHAIDSGEVNNFLKEIAGAPITAKDFRTWGGSTIALKAFIECGPFEDEKSMKKNINEAIKKVSGSLGNTPNVCKGYYIHPIVIEKYSAKEIMKLAEKKSKVRKHKWLHVEELLFLELLKKKK